MRKKAASLNFKTFLRLLEIQDEKGQISCSLRTLEAKKSQGVKLGFLAICLTKASVNSCIRKFIRSIVELHFLGDTFACCTTNVVIYHSITERYKRTQDVLSI